MSLEAENRCGTHAGVGTQCSIPDEAERHDIEGCQVGD